MRVVRVNTEPPMSPTVLNIAVCLFADAQLLDYGGPMDVLGFLNADNSFLKPAPSHLLRFTYVGPTEIVQPTAGPRALTYDQLVQDESRQFDVVFIPGGWGTTPRIVPPALLAFLKEQAPGAQYVLSVCTGSWLLAQAGLVDGKRATTNKALFDVVVSRTDASIQWVHRARWVVDGKFWTVSGVTAGLDMAFGWLGHLVGNELTNANNLLLTAAPPSTAPGAAPSAATSSCSTAVNSDATDEVIAVLAELQDEGDDTAAEDKTPAGSHFQTAGNVDLESPMLLDLLSDFPVKGATFKAAGKAVTAQKKRSEPLDVDGVDFSL